jgi:hypothetical protein
MEKYFLNYELSSKLKQKGFNKECFGYYTGDKNHLTIKPAMSRINEDDTVVTAPTFEQVFDFLKQEYGLYIETGIDQTTYPKYWFKIIRFIGNPKDLSEREWGWEDVYYSEYLYRDVYECYTASIEVAIDTI